eukprot:COSAG02_NODE_2070_length_9937_cov_21.671885_2_plen_142_part_00
MHEPGMTTVGMSGPQSAVEEGPCVLTYLETEHGADARALIEPQRALQHLSPTQLVVDGALFGITDPDQNVETVKYGATTAIDREAWERTQDATKHRHEKRKITILLKLLADYDSAEVVSKGKHRGEYNGKDQSGRERRREP